MKMAFSAVNITIAIVSMIAAIIYSGESSVFVQKLNELFHWKSGCNPSNSVGNVSLHYFSGRGRAEAIRLLLEDQQITYTETKYTSENWPEAKKAGIEAGVYTFGQVPAIITNKKHLVQSKVILQFLGRSAGLDCDCKNLEYCDVIAAGVDDLHQRRGKVIYNPNFTYTMREDYVQNTLKTWLDYFEQLAPRVSDISGGVHFASDRITWVDYLVFDMIDSNCNFINYGREDTNDESSSCATLLSHYSRLSMFFHYFQRR